MRLAIDFDGVIHEGQQPGNKMGMPVPGAKRVLESLKAQGHSVTVFTVRATTRSGFDSVCQWMDYWQIPYDTVTAVKPRSDLYVDDRGYRFRTWRKFEKDLEVIQNEDRLDGRT